MRGSPLPPAPRLAAAAILLSACAAFAAGCGANGGSNEPPLGTVSILNQTDQGMAPQTVVGFFLQPSGTMDPGPNLLPEPVPPGAIRIVGQFPPGTYNAEAQLSGGGSLIFMDLVVRDRAPTDVVIPPL